MATFTNAGGNNNGVVGTTASHDANGVVGHNSDGTARNANKPAGHGVFGGSQVPDGAGVFGAHVGPGIGAGGVGLIGVWGGSVDGVGVLGVSAPPGAKGGDGVQGITNSEIRNGIYGRNDATTSRGNNDPSGNGVLGYTRVPDGAGVLGVGGGGGIGVQGASAGHAVMGKGGFGVTGMGSIIGVWGIGQGSGWAGQFSGPVLVSGSAYFQSDVTVINPGGECLHAETQSTTTAAVAAYQTNAASEKAALYAKHAGGGAAAVFEGDVRVTGDIVLIDAADCAEDFDVADAALSEPGTVMVLGAGGRLEACTRAYDKRVVGVVSGADGFRTGIVLDKQPGVPGRRPIALMGKVFCKVDAGFGNVEAGDLLTTSPTEGHAMRAGSAAAAFGTVIGKALQPLGQGRGMIAVLVALQ
jgi:hypothetical protein